MVNDTEVSISKQNVLPRDLSRDQTTDSLPSTSVHFPELIRDQTNTSMISTDNLLVEEKSLKNSLKEGEKIALNTPSMSSDVTLPITFTNPPLYPSSNSPNVNDQRYTLGIMEEESPIGNIEGEESRRGSGEIMMDWIDENRSTNSKENGIQESKNKGTEKKQNIPGFLLKTFEIFSNDSHKNYCSWGSLNDTIIIHDAVGFASHVLPHYFKHSNFQSFVRQLNMYNFHKTIQDPQHNEFKHEFFKKGRRDLLHKIKRKLGVTDKVNGGNDNGNITGNKRNNNGNIVAQSNERVTVLENKIGALEEKFLQLKDFYEEALNTMASDNRELNRKILNLELQVKNFSNNARPMNSFPPQPSSTQSHALTRQGSSINGMPSMSQAAFYNNNQAALQNHLRKYEGAPLASNRTNSLEGGVIANPTYPSFLNSVYLPSGSTSSHPSPLVLSTNGSTDLSNLGDELRSSAQRLESFEKQTNDRLKLLEGKRQEQETINTTVQEKLLDLTDPQVKDAFVTANDDEDNVSQGNAKRQKTKNTKKSYQK